MAAPSQLVGQILGHYRILEQIGAGGMGIVYRAHDEQLERDVAIKVLPVGTLGDEAVRKRFRKEALALAKLNHPNIATIFEFSSQNSTDYLVTEYVSGQSLDEKLAHGALSEKEVVGLGIQLAQGLSAAHGHGIVHRDLKPANLRLTADGRLKILDFGLAQLMPHTSEIGLTATLTESQEITGTLPYMAPEQLRGEPADARTDIWAAGAVLYEMATAHRPFEQKVPSALTDDIIHKAPPLPRGLRSELSPKLESVILRCLEKEQTKRYQSARELGADLDRLQQLRTAPKPAVLILRLMRKPQVAIAGLLLLLVVAVGTTFFVRHDAKVRWAKRKALPEIAQLFEKQDYAAAFRLARQVEGYIPDDPLLNRLLEQFSLPISINTSPPGADVYVKLYSDVTGDWNYLGKSPLRNVRVPFWSLRWKITKLGYETIESGGLEMENDLPLDPQGGLPPRMVRVQKGEFRLGIEPAVEVPDFLIDKYEATNREFKRFVESDGYRKREYWKEKFMKDGRELSWEEAMTEFHDATNRPGPATWEVGDYAPGQDELPVSGVSWYEAAAYAEFVGKSLPTVYEWKRASWPGVYSEVLQLSNFGGKNPAQTGSHQGMGPYGTYDMAGNVKEWCWNVTGNRRYILGGAWNEAPYMFQANDALSPFERSSSNGFRLVKHLGPQPYPEVLTRPIEIYRQDYSKIKPVSKEVFKAYESLYTYDRGPLAATVEEVETVEAWRRERVSFNAAYGNERVIAYLFLPRNVSPPYQAVTYYPHSAAFVRGSSRNADMMWVDFIIKSGRAVMFPIYKGSYDRFAEVDTDSAWRDMVIEQEKDFARSIDYLETRPEIDRAKLAYYGISTTLAPIMISLEKRLKAAVLVGAGFAGFAKSKFPEIEASNFAPRVTVPVLMINGRYDFALPLESSQNPLFRLLGTPLTLKRHTVFETGHLPPRNDIVRETLDWLDRYLGPVK